LPLFISRPLVTKLHHSTYNLSMFTLTWFQKKTTIGLLILGLLVGLGGALGAFLFHELIEITTLIFYGNNDTTQFVTLLETMPLWQRILIPTIGGFLVGLIFTLAKVNEAEGEGVPEVMEALAHKRGTIRPIVAPIKIITAAITLSSGGSAGREGPVIQIGSAIGSSIAQVFKQATPERSLLLAAGAAAGIGGTFGAPAAGVLFTLEILKHRPTILRSFVIIIAAFSSDIISRQVFGYEGLRFTSEQLLPQYSISHLTLLLVLSCIAALMALLFGVILSITQRLGKKVPHTYLIRPTAGGCMIGLLGIIFPYIHEPAAYPFMVDLLSLSTLSLGLLMALLVAKMIATGITLGSGGSGGIFAPLLFMGAITGSVFGSITLLTHFGDSGITGVYVIIGMATMFAAAAHAPLTAAFITYEITENLFLLPLLLLCCFVSAFIAKHIQKESVYHH
jgi:chloride channel protein, CIC family